MKPFIPTKEEEAKREAQEKRIRNVMYALNRYAQQGQFRGTGQWLPLSKDKAESLYLLLFRTHDKLSK